MSRSSLSVFSPVSSRSDLEDAVAHVGLRALSKQGVTASEFCRYVFLFDQLV
jgi:hypothetical protein